MSGLGSSLENQPGVIPPEYGSAVAEVGKARLRELKAEQKGKAAENKGRKPRGLRWLIPRLHHR